MTATTPKAPVPTGSRPGRGPIWVIRDTVVIMRRNLLKYVRVPTLLVFSTIQPIMFVLLFAYVFGGAIAVEGSNYREFLMGGIFAQTISASIVNAIEAQRSREMAKRDDLTGLLRLFVRRIDLADDMERGGATFAQLAARLGHRLRRNSRRDASRTNRVAPLASSRAPKTRNRKT